MARLSPFRGLRYNPQFIPNLSSVLCPPYDVIPPEAKKSYYDKSPFNIIRLELGEEDFEHPHKLAGATLRRWLKEGVLLLDDKPAFYLHHHHFQHKGGRVRQGLVAAVGLNEGLIRPHEYTLPYFIEDRLQLLRASQSNISPILALYNDPQGEIADLLSSAQHSSPLITIYGEESHQLWAITQPEVIAALQAKFSPFTIYIADGHHRYETALLYKREKGIEEGDHHSVMMVLVEAHDPGLIVLPVHRLIRGLTPPTLARLKKELEGHFKVESFPSPESLFQAVEGEEGIGLLGLENPFLLKIKGETSHPQLDILILHQVVLEGVLGVDNSNLCYISDEESVCSLIQAGEFQIAFLLRPLKVEELMNIADAGIKLPGKATYFYPKPPTGLVLRPLEPDQFGSINIRNI